MFAARVKAAWHDLLRNFSDKKHIWVFTSGGPIATSVIRALQTNEADMIRLNAKLMNTSLTRFYCDLRAAENFKIELLSYNEHAHVTGKHASLRSYR